MGMHIVVIAQFILGYTLTFLLIAFGIWVYRKSELRSLPWALAYLILGIVSGIIFYILKPYLSLQQHQNIHSSQYATAVKDMMTYMVAARTWEAGNQLLLGVLLLADCAFLISKAGGNLTGKFANFWRWIYAKSTIIGCILIASIILRIIWSVVLW
jgi:hypothetical protein